MVDPGDGPAPPQRVAALGAQLEAQEMHRGGSWFHWPAPTVFIGDGIDPLTALHLQPDLVSPTPTGPGAWRLSPGRRIPP